MLELGNPKGFSADCIFHARWPKGGGAAAAAAHRLHFHMRACVFLFSLPLTLSRLFSPLCGVLSIPRRRRHFSSWPLGRVCVCVCVGWASVCGRGKR